MRRLSLLALSVAVVAAVVLALGPRAVLTAPGSALPWSVFGSGGGASSSSNYGLGSTAGQVSLPGQSESTSYALAAGYWGRALDTDVDGAPNMTDVCPNDANNDGDSDDFCAGNGFQPPMIGDNDNCPAVPNAGQENADGDQWGDACETADCINVATSWFTPVGDGDCDGWTTDREDYLITDPTDACAATPGQNDEGPPDVWPVDLNDDQKGSMQDVIFAFVTTLAPDGLNQDAIPPLNRVDMNGDTWINMQDVILGFLTRLAPTGLNTMCTP
jgi:hypothetical protein